jgi:predicted homoserine dehydrogenase-like protein
MAVFGAGDYARGLIAQTARMPGMRCAVVCDRDTEAALRSYESAGVGRRDITVATDRAMVRRALSSGAPCVVPDAELLQEADVEVLVDCTGDPESGARAAEAAIERGIHVVMVNVEADVTVGTELAAAARRTGCVYSLADGDQPSLMVGLADWASALGFDILAAGKWTDAYSPDEAEAQLRARAAERPDKTPRPSDVTFLDGSKTHIEMASAANALGLNVPAGGLQGPGLDLREIPEYFRAPGGEGEPGAAGSGMVEYIDCRKLDPDRHIYYGGGVFVCVESPARAAMETMAKKGVVVSADLRRAVFYRPYHLVGAETAWTILRAVLDGVATGEPAPERMVEVVAEAKIDLPGGRILGGLGTEDVAGRAVPAGVAREQGLLPIGLAAGCRLRNAVSAGSRVRVRDMEPPADSCVWRLRGFRGEEASSL